MKVLQRLDNWRKTKLGLGIFIAIEAMLAYLFGSLAIRDGGLLDYAITFLLVVVLVQDMTAFILVGVKKAKVQKTAADKKAKKD
jgi:hypothetical protein